MQGHDLMHLRPSATDDKSKSVKYSSRQKTIVFLIGLANLVGGTIVSIQAPFYPKEAESKGASPTEYGFVLGVFQLVIFVMSFVYGSILHLVNPRVVFNLGTLVAAVSVILFGFLDFVDDHKTFIRYSLLLRNIQALGEAAFITVAFTVIATQFPESIASTFGIFSTCFGVGLVVGPGVGGYLYGVGGFLLPFLFMGGCFFIVAFLNYCLMPEMNQTEKKKQGEDEIDGVRYKSGLCSLMSIPVVMLASLSVGTCATTTGFLSSTLEPHLRKHFGLTPLQTGLMFIIDGSAYALSAPLWGRLVDGSTEPKMFTFIGALFTFIGFLFIGPAPFIPLDTFLGLTCIGLVIHGFGQGASCVSAFGQAMKGAIDNGFSDSISTYGLVSGLWMSSYSMGAFLGPCIGGILFDNYGFKLGSVFILGAQLVVMFLTSILICTTPNKKK